MSSLVFVHEAAQALYNKANSNEFANLQVPNDMRDYIQPFINAVIENKLAYEETVTKWWQFSTVKKHLDTEKPQIENLDLNTSMCTSLWMYIYH
jgi:hypothetical protein